MFLIKLTKYLYYNTTLIVKDTGQTAPAPKEKFIQILIN